MSVRSAVNAVLTELVRSLSRALAAVLWRPSPGEEDPGGPSLSSMDPTSMSPPPPPPHIFLFLFTLMWKADGDEEDRRKAVELEELVRSSEPDPSLPFSSSSSERRAMSPYKKRPAGGAVRSMANVIFTATTLWQLLVNPRDTSSCWLSPCNVCKFVDRSCSKNVLLMLLTEGVHPFNGLFTPNFFSLLNVFNQVSQMSPLWCWVRFGLKDQQVDPSSAVKSNLTSELLCHRWLQVPGPSCFSLLVYSKILHIPKFSSSFS